MARACSSAARLTVVLLLGPGCLLGSPDVESGCEQRHGPLCALFRTACTHTAHALHMHGSLLSARHGRHIRLGAAPVVGAECEA